MSRTRLWTRGEKHLLRLGLVGCHAFENCSDSQNATPAQIALAWLQAQEPWVVPIPGTSKLHRLEENSGAVSVELTSDDLREIDSAASKIEVQGARYTEEMERRTGL